MLDMAIRYNYETDRLESQLYDKRQSQKLSLTPITKYSLADSMMSAQMSLNIMYSQCFRYYGVSHTWESFARACGSVLYEMYQAGYNFNLLQSTSFSSLPHFSSLPPASNHSPVLSLQTFSAFPILSSSNIPIFPPVNTLQFVFDIMVNFRCCLLVLMMSLKVFARVARWIFVSNGGFY